MLELCAYEVATFRVLLPDSSPIPKRPAKGKALQSRIYIIKKLRLTINIEDITPFL
jgi:hypothetical protein